MIKETDNKKLAKRIRERLAEDSHCPCQKEKTDDTICPCKKFQEQKEGTCHCGLFEKVPDEVTLTQYDLLKSIVGQTPTLTKEQIEQGKEKLKVYIKELKTSSIILLNRERADFTLFDVTDRTVDVVLQALQNRGELIDFGKEDVWIRVEEEVFLYKILDATPMTVSCNNVEVER